jgi:hypothetical protein
MKKVELVYRAVMEGYIRRHNEFTQKGLARDLGISLGGVNKAVSQLAAINAVRVDRRSFSVIAIDRLVMYWATHRNLEKDVVLRLATGIDVGEIEGSLPEGIAFTAYSAYKRLYANTPADYGEVYVYATPRAVDLIAHRFRSEAGFPNLFVLRADAMLELEIAEHRLAKGCAPVSQVLVDLWNIRSWYAKEFYDALYKMIVGEG